MNEKYYEFAIFKKILKVLELKLSLVLPKWQYIVITVGKQNYMRIIHIYLVASLTKYNI